MALIVAFIAVVAQTAALVRSVAMARAIDSYYYYSGSLVLAETELGLASQGARMEYLNFTGAAGGMGMVYDNGSYFVTVGGMVYVALK